MKSFFAGGLSAAVVVGAALSVAHAAPPAITPVPSYHLAATWKLAGDGGWDYLNVDSRAHRLYIARGNRIQVLDCESGALVGEVPGLSGAHGVALDPNAPVAYATSGRTNSVIAFNTRTLQPIGQPIPVGQRPDAILFEPKTKTVWAFDAGSNQVSIIDPKTAKLIITTELGGNPEFGVSDEQGHVFVNIENTSEIVELDAKSGRVLHRTSLAPGEEPSGLVYDAAGKTLFSGCANKSMVVTNAKTLKVVKSLEVGDGIDAAAFDPKRKLAFSSNGEDGTISVVGFKDAVPTVLATIPTHVGARTMTIDKTNGALFVVAADYEKPDPTAGAEREGHWPKMVPGSAVVMKLVPDGQ